MDPGRDAAWTLRGLHFAGLEWGEPTGRPTIFLHGFLDHAGSWARVAGGLPGYRVAYDQRGHGRSAHVTQGETYHFPEYLADLDALVDALRARTGASRVALVGQSMGGTVASLYAGARPDVVDRLAIVDGLGLHDGGDDARDRLVTFLDGVKAEPVNRVFEDVAAAAARLRQSHVYIDEAWSMTMAARITRPVPGGVTWTWDARHRIRGPTPYRHQHHQALLRAIACPALVIVPEHSPFQAVDIDALAGAIPGARRVVIPGASHMVHMDAPAALAGALAPFLSGA